MKRHFYAGCAIFFVVFCATGSLAAINITVNYKDGDVVGDIVPLKFTVNSDTGISKIEISIDDQVRATLTKEPWEFKWDTVDEDERPHTVMVAVYDVQGKTGRKRFKLEVDNLLDKGVKYHSTRALTAFWNNDIDKALIEGRKAHKINIADVDGIRAFAAGVGGKGDYTRALDMLEKQPRVNNNLIGKMEDYPMRDRASLELRGQFRIMRAEKQATADKMMLDLAEAYDFWRKTFENYLTDIRAKYPAVDTSPEARMAVGDALFYHGEYEAALDSYKQISGNKAVLTSADLRIIAALLRVNRLTEAEERISKMIREQRDNPTMRALNAALLLQQRKFKAAGQELDTAIAGHSLTGQLVSAYADPFTGKYGRAQEMANAVTLRAQPTQEVQFMVANYLLDSRDFKNATLALFAAMRAAPGMLDVYALRGFQLAVLAPADGFKQAETFFDFVLERDPKHISARLGKAIILIQTRKFRQAEPILKELTREDRFAADIWVALAAAHAGKNDQLAATEALATARKLDPERFPDTLVPMMATFMGRVAKFRRVPIITPQILTVEESGKDLVPVVITANP